MENVVKEESKNKNLIIGVLVFVIVLLLAVLVYFVFIKKDGTQQPVKPQDNQQVDDNKLNNTTVSNGVYKTVDGKFTLTVVDNKNSKVLEETKKIFYEDQKELAKDNCLTNKEFENIKCNNIDEGFDTYFNDYYNTLLKDIKGYAYLNEKLLYIYEFIEDDNYVSYNARFVKSADAAGSLWNRFIVDKNNKIIWESPVFLDYDNWKDEIFDRFKGMNMYFFKTDAGYYFAEEVEPGYRIYTKNGKMIGCVVDYNNINSDKNGIYVYENFDSNILIKYDINGNKIN